MKLGWQIAVVAVAVGTGLFLSRKPWQVYRQKKLSVQQAQAEMAGAERERERLTKEKMKYETSLGKEEILRNKGLVKKGEVPIDR